MLAPSYDFPVELRKLKTFDGIELPRSRAIVRTDTNEAISVVSDKYRVITHRSFADAVTPFVKELGEPEIHYNVLRGGASFAVEYLFKNHQIEIAGQNRLAMRLIMTNTYLPGQSARLRVAGLVLECLNCCIAAEKSIFNLAVRHAGDVTNIDFPTPDKVLASFTSGAAIYQKFGEHILKKEEGAEFFAVNKDVAAALPDTTRDIILNRWLDKYNGGEKSVWNLLQHATYVITHQSKRLTYTGRLQRLQKTARLFNHAFAGY